MAIFSSLKGGSDVTHCYVSHHQVLSSVLKVRDYQSKTKVSPRIVLQTEEVAEVIHFESPY